MTKMNTAALALSLYLGSFSLSSRLPADIPPVATRVLVEAPLPLSLSRPSLTPPVPMIQAPRPRPWLAAAECAGLNLAVWAFFHYVEDAQYTYISWDTMRDNVQDSFEWDPNLFCVNFFHHPYHGASSFNTARSNGLGYWGSTFSAFGGSLMWELLLELNRPSINDLVLTTTGGSVFGEVTYRLASSVRRKGARGFERIPRGRRAAANGRSTRSPSAAGSGWRMASPA